MTVTSDDLYHLADELRAVASLGLYFTLNEYDLERYDHILQISLRLFAALEERSFDKVMQEFHEDNWLHASPMAGAEAVVYHEERILLIQRRDNGLWAVPGGLVEVGETLAEAAQRELKEETGINGRASKLLGIFDSRVWRSRTKAHLYHTIFLMEAENILPDLGPEVIDAGFFAEDHLPKLSPGHQLRVPLLFKLIRGEIPTPYFDLTHDDHRTIR